MRRLWLLLLPLAANAQWVGETPLAVSSLTSGSEVGQFVNGAKSYSDQEFIWEDVPEQFHACQSIQTEYADRGSTGDTLISFTLSKSTQVTVWLSDNLVGSNPSWLATEGYTDSGHNIPLVDFAGALSGYSAVKSGSVTLGGNTSDEDATAPMYVVSLCPAWRQVFPAAVLDPSEVGEYRFVTTSADIPESDTTVVGTVERITGTSGAVSVNVDDNANGTCAAGSDYTAITADTKSWGDGVGGTVAGVSVIAGDVSADCTIELEFENAAGGITAALDNQTFTVTIVNSVETANIFVDDDCTVGNQTGAELTPYCDPEDAVEASDPGDIICLKNGIYTDHDADGRIIEFDSTQGGTSGNLKTLKNCVGETAVWIGNQNSDTGSEYGLISRGADYVRVEGLNFGVSEFKCAFINTSSGNNSTGWELVGNHFENCGAIPNICTNTSGHNAITTSGGTSHLLIDGNYFESTGRIRDLSCDSMDESLNHQYRHDHAMYLKGKYITVTNNVIVDSYAGFGIKIDGYDQTLGQITSGQFSHIIANNTFGPNTNPNAAAYGCSSGECSGAAGRPFNSTANSYNPRWLWKNNVVLDQGDVFSAVLISNNGSSNFTTDNQCEHNMAETDSGAQMSSMCSTHQAYVTGTNVDQADNTLDKTLASFDFTDAVNFDYRIGATSDLIEAGDCAFTGAPTTDFDGNARSATTCDIGAFEYTP